MDTFIKQMHGFALEDLCCLSSSSLIALINGDIMAIVLKVIFITDATEHVEI